MTNEIASITVLVPCYMPPDTITNEIVSFKIYKDQQRFKAIPLISKEERKLTGLPEELLFGFVDHCVVSARNTGEETLDVMKQIILELQMQQLI